MTTPDVHPFTTARRWIAGIPLRVKLVALTSAVLVIGLVVAGVAAATFLERDLMTRTDQRLMEVANPVANALVGQGNAFSGPQLPSSYFVQIAASDGTVIGKTSDDAYGLPDAKPKLPSLTYDQAVTTHGAPFTVGSVSGDTRWRVTTQTRVFIGNGTMNQFVLQIAMPLTDVDSTLDQLRLLLISSGLVVVVLGSAGGYVAVRRSLRPLRDVESTARAIAQGDLSQRVPTLPETTELGRVSAALNVMLAQIETAFAVQKASEERMRRFVSDASHELRTPLASIRGFGELYRMGAIPQDQVGGSMKRIEDEAIRMGSLVEDLLALARLDERRPLRHDPVDLTVLAADAAQDAHALAPDRQVTIVRLESSDSTERTSTWTLGDERSLRQVVANLVGNAVNHTPVDTPIEILVGHAGTTDSVIAVRDHGPGIDPAEAQRIFERFYRTDSSRVRGSGGGSGLGLAIASAIATAHHGAIEVTETPGGGATMTFRLPRWAPKTTSPEETIPADDDVPGQTSI